MIYLTLLTIAILCIASTAFIKTSDRKIDKDLGYDKP